MRVRGEHDAVRFRDPDHDGIDRGAAPGLEPEPRAAPSQGLWEFGDDVTGLEQPVGRRVPSGLPGEAFDEDRRGHPMPARARRFASR